MIGFVSSCIAKFANIIYNFPATIKNLVNTISKVAEERIFKPFSAKWRPRKVEHLLQNDLKKAINQNGWTLMNQFLTGSKIPNFQFSVLDYLAHFAKISKGIVGSDQQDELKEALYMQNPNWADQILEWEVCIAKGVSPGIKHCAATLVRNDVQLVEENEEVIKFKDAPNGTQVGNEWVNKATNGEIQDLIDNLDPSTVITFLTASIFESKWKYPFSDEANTKLNDFINHDGTKIQFPRMTNATDCLRFARLVDMRVMELPFEGDRFSLLIFLPDAKEAGASLNTLKQFFDHSNPEDVLENLNVKLRKKASMKVGVPKAVLEFQANFCEAIPEHTPIKMLQKLDVKNLTKESPIDALRIQGMYIKNKLELTEKDMKFVQAQYTPVYRESCPPPPFNVDHPFAWMVVQNDDKGKLSTVFFMGVVGQLEDMKG